MQYRQRRFIAAAVLVISTLIAGYLIFLTPSEQEIANPVNGTGQDSGGSSLFTPIASTPETELKRTSEAETANREVTPQGSAPQSNVEIVVRDAAPIPEWMSRVSSQPVNTTCPEAATREVKVSTAAGLAAALLSAQPGDRIFLAPGSYGGTFEAAISGEQSKRIWICGSRSAILDAGGPTNGYGLHIIGNYVGVWGLTVANAQIGIVVDGADFVQIDNVEVRTTGDQGIHFRANATDGVVQDSLVHQTGLRDGASGQGIEIGSAVSDWPKVSGGDPDKSDRTSIERNRVWDVTAEAIDLNEGTSDGQLIFNSFDGSNITKADSWVDVKGNSYLIRGNVGIASPDDGFQTHNIGNMGWGENNQFVGNTAQVNGPGYGIYIQDSGTTNNFVSCTNIVTSATSGFSNQECSSSTAFISKERPNKKTQYGANELSGRNVNHETAIIPSPRLKLGDLITVKPRGQSTAILIDLISQSSYAQIGITTRRVSFTTPSRPKSHSSARSTWSSSSTLGSYLSA